MKIKGSNLFFIGLSMFSALVGFAQVPNEERAPIVAPVPRAIKYCMARMTNENKMLELTACSQQVTDKTTYYDVSLPVIVNGQKNGYRKEAREITRKVTTFQYAHCELEAGTVAAYQPDGKRLTTQQVSDQLNLREATPVVLSDARPDDLMATVLAEDCIVVVLPDGDLKFQIRNLSED